MLFESTNSGTVALVVTPRLTTVARFRAENAALLEGLFVQALRLCAEAGLIQVGMVALDGKRVKANASMAANRTGSAIEEEVKAILAEAAATDATEDAVHGQARGDELPRALADRRSRLHRLRQARAHLEAEEQARLDAHAERMEKREATETQRGTRLRGRKPSPPSPSKEPQANVSDPDSKIMKTHHGFIQGYNGQALVTEHQIVIATDLTNDQADTRLLHPMLSQATANLRAVGVRQGIGVLVADAGYYSDASVGAETPGGPELLIATAKGWKERKAAEAHPPRGRIPGSFTTRQRMGRKLRPEGFSC